MKRFFVTAVAATALFASVAHAGILSGKSMAVAGSGLATADFTQGYQVNPAAPANTSQGDSFRFYIDVAAFAADQDELIDAADDLSDTIDMIDQSMGGRILPGSATRLLEQIGAVDGKEVLIDAGGGIAMSIPIRRVTVDLFSQTSIQLGAMANASAEDMERLRIISELVDDWSGPGAPVNGFGDLTGANTPAEHLLYSDELTSEVIARGTATTETGMNFALKSADEKSSYGVTIKHQRVDMIDYSATVDDYDVDDLDADDYRTKGSGINVDVGYQQHFDNWHLGVVGRNLIERKYTGIDGRTIKIEPRYTVGAGYRNGWFILSADVDANSVPNLINGEESQFARVGVTIDAFGWVQFRGGYRTDLESSRDDLVSFGIGLSPFKKMNIDVSAIRGGDNSLGGAVQLGFRF